MEGDGIETEADFAQDVADAGIVEWLLQDGVEVGEVPETAPPAADPPRDEKGRFVSSKEETEEATEETPTAETTEVAETEAEEVPEEDGDLVLEIDETLQGVLDRYGGDLGKALQALAEKDSFIGRQGNEMGELRSELAALREAVMQVQQPPQFVGPYVNDLDENPKALLAEAMERGDQQTVQLALEAWGEEEPFAAAAFLMHLQTIQAQAPPPASPVHQGSEASLESAMSAVVERHPDVEKYLPAIGEAAKEFPTLRSFMEQGTPAQKAQAFEELLVIAKSRSSSSATSEAVKRVVLKTQEEVRKEKADAAVVSASTQSAATAQKTGLDSFFEAFDEAAERLAGSGWITRSDD